MVPVVALETLRDAVLAMAGAVVLLSLCIPCERAIGALLAKRGRPREALLTRLVYRAIQDVPRNSSDWDMLTNLDRRQLRGILLRLALDLRGDSGEAIAALYSRLGFLAADLKRLRSWWAPTRADAAADLGLVRATEALPALLDRLHDPDARVRRTAVWAVGQVGDPTTLAVLVALLGDGDRMVARRAEEVLAERGRETKDAILAYAVKTASRTGRLAAIELIGWLRIVEGADLLMGYMRNLDPEVRVKSVKAAAAIGDPRFVASLHERLGDTRWEVRCQAAKGLSALGGPESVSRLDAAMRDEHWWVRFYAATALAEVGPEGTQALLSAMVDPASRVRAMARYLLERGAVVPTLP